jgi:hypothetical protein
MLQEDLYPPTFSGLPSHTCAEWLAGSDLPPKLCSLDPADAGKEVRGGGGHPRFAFRRRFSDTHAQCQVLAFLARSFTPKRAHGGFGCFVVVFVWLRTNKNRWPTRRW